MMGLVDQALAAACRLCVKVSEPEVSALLRKERMSFPIDPILTALAAWESADRNVRRVLAETAGDESPVAEARCRAADDRRDALEKALSVTMPTTLPGLAALIRHYAAVASDPESDGFVHLVEAASVFAGGRP